MRHQAPGSSPSLSAPFRLLKEVVQVNRLLGARGAWRYATCLLRGLPEVWQRKSLGPADARLALPLTVRGPSGPLRINSGDFGVVREIFGSRCYDYGDWIRHSHSFLDLGANEGIFTLYALAAHSANHVTAVEAQASLCGRLRANLRLNRLEERAHVICGLAGGSNRQLEPLAATTPPLDMDGLIQVIGPIDFLKIDIEGSEFALLEPPAGWLRNVHYIAMEVHYDSGDSESLRKNMREHGFVIRSEQKHRDFGYLFLENPTFAS